MKIKNIHGREILNSGATTSIEVKVLLEDGAEAKASVPFGVSAGRHEAAVLFDGDRRYQGKGMLKAVNNVNTEIQKALIDQNAYDQSAIDQKMIDLDGTENKARLGGNAILGVSLAVARAAAKSQKLELYEYISLISNLKSQISKPQLKSQILSQQLPLPMIVVIEGGRHADDSTDFQEYLIVPQVSQSARENIRCGAEVYLELKRVLKSKGYNTNIGNEGAYAPAGIKTNSEPWELILEAIKRAGYEPGKQVMLAVDSACSELVNSKFQIPNSKFYYHLKRGNSTLSSKELIDYFAKWIEKYPFISLEDILAEDDWKNWAQATALLGKKVRIIGDDLLVTNPKRLKRAIAEQSCNAILIKLNQIGTLTETLKTIEMAHKAGFWAIVSHRGGGETNDTAMIDLAVGSGCRMVKVGISRGERVCKYNRLMEIESKIKNQKSNLKDANQKSKIFEL